MSSLHDITPADVKAFAPELSVIADAAWVDLLAYVNEMQLDCLDTDVDRRLARIFLAAHFGTLIRLGAGGAAGPVTSESAGGVRRSYGMIATGSGSGSYATTRYGQIFADLIDGSAVGGPLLI